VQPADETYEVHDGPVVKKRPPKARSKPSNSDTESRRRRPRLLSNRGMFHSSSIWGGILLMVGAATWFFVGLFVAGYIFFYPPVLFVAGLLAFLRGILGRE
jgi:hypothetical protein